MTKEELKDKLTELGVAEWYSLNGELIPDKFIVDHWDFFHLDERGNTHPITSQMSESDTYGYVYKHAKDFADIWEKAGKDTEGYAYRKKHTETVVTEIQGEGFVMAETKQVFEPPKEDK